VLIQAFEKAQAPAPDLVRSVEALRHTSLMVTLTDVDGTILLQNPAATRAFGSTHPLADRFVDEVVSEAILAAARAGEVFLLETQVKTEEGAKWHAIEARTLRDPATGAIVVLIQHTDETLRRQAEQRAVIEGQLAEELRGTLAVVEQQKAEIIALSAPILEVSAGTIAVPIIGTLDSERAQALEQSILAMVSNRGAMSVILDLTGTNALSTAQTVEQVVRLGRAIRLLGAQTIVTGIMSTLARTLVTADVDMGGVLLLRSLRDGIAAAGKRHGR
jgi:anti-anti-sigma regulatory factor